MRGKILKLLLVYSPTVIVGTMYSFSLFSVFLDRSGVPDLFDLLPDRLFRIVVIVPILLSVVFFLAVSKSVRSTFSLESPMNEWGGPGFFKSERDLLFDSTLTVLVVVALNILAIRIWRKMKHRGEAGGRAR